MIKKEKLKSIFRMFCEHTGRFGMKIYQSFLYHGTRGRWPNFRDPQDISVRILASMQKKEFLKYADLADKVKVHEYIRQKGLGHILLEHYATWDSVEHIDICDVPEKFILKPNNGSGGHVICRDKRFFDLDKAKQTIESAFEMAKHYYFEPHYMYIKPQIICEQLLDLGPGILPTDYKFTCVKGHVVDVFIAVEDSNGNRKYNTVDINWNLLPYTKKEYLLENIPDKPSKLDEMVKYAEILSADFDFVRVDFYEYDNKVYFSELTFSPWGGYLFSYTNKAVEKYEDYYRSN